MEQVARVDSDPYGRLLQRLVQALKDADSLSRLSDEPPLDLEVRGLSVTELTLIQAYLASDHARLSSWHRAAGQSTAARQLREPGSPPFRRKPALCCNECVGATLPDDCPSREEQSVAGL